MGAIQDRLKKLQQEANQRAMATVVEEPVAIPKDVDPNRLMQIANELRMDTIATKDTIVTGTSKILNNQILPMNINIDSLVGVIEEIPETEEEEIIEEVEEENFEEGLEDIPEIPEFPIEEPSVEDIKEPEIPQQKLSARSLTGLVVSVTTMPFIPSRHPTNGEKPIPTTRYQVLIDLPQPLQLGKEYQILL